MNGWIYIKSTVIIFRQASSGDGNVGLSTDPDWNISTATGWSAMKFGKDFGDLLTFSLVQQSYLVLYLWN